MRIGIDSRSGDLPSRAGGRYGGCRMSIVHLARRALCSVLILPAGVLSGDDRSTPGDGSTQRAHPAIGEAGALQEGFAQIIGTRFMDVDGNIRWRGDENGAGPGQVNLSSPTIRATMPPP